jgi:hypothetical protein
MGRLVGCDEGLKGMESWGEGGKQEIELEVLDHK